MTVSRTEIGTVWRWRTTWEDRTVDLVFTVLPDELRWTGVEVADRGNPSRDATRVNGTLLRQIPWGRLELDARQAWLARIEGVADELPPELAQRARRSLATYQPSRSGRPSLSDEHLAEVAHVYTDAWSAGRAPAAAVAERFVVAEGTARNWVKKARDRGVLGPAAETPALGRRR